LKLEGFDSTIDLEVKAGEVVGITGLEGHGQSVLLRTLFGMNQPCPLIFKGEEIEIHKPGDAVKKRFAFISGDRTREGVFGERSISDNADVVINQVLRQKVNDILGILTEFNVKFGSMKHRILSLSGGNQQKVVIARWVASNPTVLLADDPTKGVDVQARKDIHEIFVSLAAKGSIVLMVSSDEEELISMSKMTPCSKVLVMYEGQIVKVLTGKDINKDNISLASMQVKVGA
jgi:ABC-type sugar transport system ATPase subunit